MKWDVPVYSARNYKGLLNLYATITWISSRCVSTAAIAIASTNYIYGVDVLRLNLAYSFNKLTRKLNFTKRIRRKGILKNKL